MRVVHITNVGGDVHVAQHVDSVTGHWGSAAVASGVEGMPVRAFRVTLPSGERYWTVVDHEYRVVGDVDEYLRHLRFGQDCAESTTKAYAESLALYLRWCERSERDWVHQGRAAGRVRHLAQAHAEQPGGFVVSGSLSGARAMV